MRFELLLLLLPLLLVIPLDADAFTCPSDETHIIGYYDIHVCVPPPLELEVTTVLDSYSQGQFVSIRMVADSAKSYANSQYILNVVSDSDQMLPVTMNKVGGQNIWFGSIPALQTFLQPIGNYTFTLRQVSNVPINGTLILTDAPFPIDPDLTVTTNATNYSSGETMEVIVNSTGTAIPTVHIYNENNSRVWKTLEHKGGTIYSLALPLDALDMEFSTGIQGKIKILVENNARSAVWLNATYVENIPIVVTLDPYTNRVIYGGVLTFSGTVSNKVVNDNYVTFKWFKTNDPIPASGTDAYINMDRTFTHTQSFPDGSFQPPGIWNGVVEYQNNRAPIIFELSDRPLTLYEKTEIAYSMAQNNTQSITTNEDLIDSHGREMGVFRPLVMLIESINNRLASIEGIMPSITFQISGLGDEIAINTANITSNKADIDFLYQVLNMTEPIP